MACGPSSERSVHSCPTMPVNGVEITSKTQPSNIVFEPAPAPQAQGAIETYASEAVPAVARIEALSSPPLSARSSSGAAAPGHRERPTVRSSTEKKVRFDVRLTTAVWIADSNYDRRSIVVDLSRTPFALFRKDALLMAKPTAVAATSTTSSSPSARTGPRETTPVRRCSKERLVSPGSPVATGGPHAKAVGRASTAVAPAAGCAPQARAGTSAIATATAGEEAQTRPRSEFFGSWDSEESDGSAVTDTEELSDFEESNQERRPEAVERHTVEPAFFGVWKRESSEGYETLLLNSGVPKRAAAVALRKHPIHIIDHDGSYFRLIVKNGLSKVDNTFFIGDEPRVDIINKQSYEISVNWVDLSGDGKRDELSLSSVCSEREEEVIAIRTLTNGGNRMVLTQIVRRPKDNYEARAKHFFKRVTDRSELRSNDRPSPSCTVKVNRRVRQALPNRQQF